MREPVHIAAIDAGSNALRLLAARVEPSGAVVPLERKRFAVRLGRGVFTSRTFDDETIDRAVRAFEDFRRILDRHNVRRYRAVATSATRIARNRRVLLDRIREKTGIELEVIDGIEEAALVRTAVLETLGPGQAPGLVADLGGGSLEICFLRDGALEQTLTLPIGTVRLLETLGFDGALNESQHGVLTRHIRDVLGERLPQPRRPMDGLAVAVGGNAETLAEIAPGRPVNGLHTLDLEDLSDALPRILARDVAQRRKDFGVRKDRAEVMGIAAVVLTCLGTWLGVRELHVPGVGVREGIIYEIARTAWESPVQSRTPAAD